MESIITRNMEDLLLTPSDIIHKRTQDEIDVFLSAWGKSKVYQGAKNLSLNVSDDYGDRFLVELIQNAHDAHPKHLKNGSIKVYFNPDETEYGCLYIANKGNCVSDKDFLGITNIALTGKAVNEGIGNKGLGFRSILQVCQSPEIYSTKPNSESGSFDGYCFRFAALEDLLSTHSFIHNNSTLKAKSLDNVTIAKNVLDNTPCFYLPIYEDNRPGAVNELAEEGFATVIRLPLKSHKSSELTAKQIKLLVQRTEPLNLFLERIEQITIIHHKVHTERLNRNQVLQHQIDPSTLVQRVALGDHDYLIGHLTLNEKEFNEELKYGIENDELPEAWRDWEGKAIVSVAVNLSKPACDGLMYCYLPLGSHGVSPFRGYINANFYTSLDRRALINDVGRRRCHTYRRWASITRGL